MIGGLMIAIGYLAAIVALWPWGLLAVAAHIAVLALLTRK